MRVLHITLTSLLTILIKPSQSFHHQAFKARKSTVLSSIPNPLDTFTSGLASIARFRGVSVSPQSLTNQSTTVLLKLSDLEGNASCRRVREVVTELDLNVLVVPTKDDIPKLEVQSISGDDVEEILFGADEIVFWLWKNYSTSGSEPIDEENIILNPALEKITRVVPDLLRLNRGSRIQSNLLQSTNGEEEAPCKAEKPLILYSYEGNQFCRLVREVLSELGIKYELRSAGKGSLRREELAEITGGSTQCPFLIDPNRNVKMAESKDIVEYLYKHYALYTPPSSILKVVSDAAGIILKPIYSKLAPLQAGEEYDVEAVKAAIENEIKANPVVIYTYGLSPFCWDAMSILDSRGIEYKEISLGKEWVPLLVDEGGAEKRAELGKMTGQTSLPHIFVNGQSIGGLYTGTPGLIPSIEEGSFTSLFNKDSDVVLNDTNEESF